MVGVGVLVTVGVGVSVGVGDGDGVGVGLVRGTQHTLFSPHVALSASESIVPSSHSRAGLVFGDTGTHDFGASHFGFSCGTQQMPLGERLPSREHMVAAFESIAQFIEPAWAGSTRSISSRARH